MIKTDEGYLSPILLRFSLYVHSGTICGFFITTKSVPSITFQMKN